MKTTTRPVQSEADFFDRLRAADPKSAAIYKRLPQDKKLIAREGIEQRMFACDRLDVPFHPSIAREIIEDARKGLAIYLEV